MAYYQVEKMDGYYRIGSPEGVFCYLIEGTEKAALIDTGYGYGDLNGTVRKITDKPLLIFNTHGHVDHTCGNALFEEPCYIGEKDMELCRQHTSREMRKDSVERARHSIDYETGREFDGLPENFDEEKFLAGGCGNLVPVKEGDRFDLGGAVLKVYETPGHTRGGISLLYEEKNLLFIGDATGFFVWLFSDETTDLDTYMAAVQKMYDLNCDGYLGGHNPLTIQREELPRYIQAAREADYEKGQPFQAFFGMEFEPRVCALDGMTLDDMFRPGFASVVIGKDKRKQRD